MGDHVAEIANGNQFIRRRNNAQFLAQVDSVNEGRSVFAEQQDYRLQDFLCQDVCGPGES